MIPLQGVRIFTNRVELIQVAKVLSGAPRDISIVQILQFLQIFTRGTLKPHGRVLLASNMIDYR